MATPEETSREIEQFQQKRESILNKLFRNLTTREIFILVGGLLGILALTFLWNKFTPKTGLALAAGWSIITYFILSRETAEGDLITEKFAKEKFLHRLREIQQEGKIPPGNIEIEIPAKFQSINNEIKKVWVGATISNPTNQDRYYIAALHPKSGEFLAIEERYERFRGDLPKDHTYISSIEEKFARKLGWKTPATSGRQYTQP